MINHRRRPSTNSAGCRDSGQGRSRTMGDPDFFGSRSQREHGRPGLLGCIPGSSFDTNAPIERMNGNYSCAQYKAQHSFSPKVAATPYRRRGEATTPFVPRFTRSTVRCQSSPPSIKPKNEPKPDRIMEKVSQPSLVHARCRRLLAAGETYVLSARSDNKPIGSPRDAKLRRRCISSLPACAR